MEEAELVSWILGQGDFMSDGWRVFSSRWIVMRLPRLGLLNHVSGFESVGANAWQLDGAYSRGEESIPFSFSGSVTCILGADHSALEKSRD